MFKLTWSVIVVVLAISIASAAEIRFNEALFNQTDCSTTVCSFAWNDQDSWIGGRVPRRNDDVFISDSPYEIEIHCPYYCEARSISGKNLFFNMTKMNALVNVTTFDVNSISFANGVLRSSLITANETVELDGVVTVNTGTLSVFASAFRLTDSDVDLVTLNASIIASYSSKLRVDSTLVVASEWSVENSTLRFYGTCQCPIDATSSSLIQASEVHVRTSCSFCLDDVLAVLESRWIIENVPSANETATYELTSAEFEFSESTLLVADNVKLVINQIVTLADSQIESTNTIHLAQLGALKGSGRIVSSITADYSSILAPGSGDLTIYGLVTLDEGSTLLIDNGTLFVTTLQIFNNTKLSIAEGSTITELVVATDLIAGSFSEIELHLTSFQLVYNYTHIYIQMGVDNEPQSSEEPSSDAPHAVHQPYQQSPSSSVNPPSGEEAGTDGKLVAIVILSILLGMMTLAVAVLVFKMRQLQAGYMPLNSKVLPFADDDM